MPAEANVSRPAATAPATGSLVRKIGPAIPLAIALLHGTLTETTTPRPPAGPAPLSGEARPGTAGCGSNGQASGSCPAPYPLLAAGHPVDWWFVFKLNSHAFPQCGNGDTRSCPFDPGRSPTSTFTHFGQQFVYSSSEHPALQDGGQQCLGTTLQDPLGATYDEIYHGSFHYVVWNDQPYGDPPMKCGSSSCGAPWAHSKGLLAWNEEGSGMVLQVSTPDWPLAGSAAHPRKSDGSTLGCTKDNNVEVSQHFFALRLTKGDLVTVLEGLNTASIATDPNDPQVVNNGGPADVQQLVKSLGKESSVTQPLTGTLTSGVELIAKPSRLAVPPWQLVSSILGGASLHVANWWTNPDKLPSTNASNATAFKCWDASLNAPGPVENATTGSWKGVPFGLLGGDNPDGNHAKIAVSTSGNAHYAVFGDMNQEGSFNGPNCTISQNGRGGLFYVVTDPQLASSIGSLIGAPADTP